MPVMYVGLILTVTLALNLSIAEAGDSGHRNPHQPSGICWFTISDTIWCTDKTAQVSLRRQYTEVYSWKILLCALSVWKFGLPSYMQQLDNSRHYHRHFYLGVTCSRQQCIVTRCYFCLRNIRTHLLTYLLTYLLQLLILLLLQLQLILLRLMQKYNTDFNDTVLTFNTLYLVKLRIQCFWHHLRL